MRTTLTTLAQRTGSRNVTEQAAIAGALDDKVLSDVQAGEKLAVDLAARLNAIASEGEKGWKAEFTPVGGYVLSRMLRGVQTKVRIAPDHIKSAEAVRLHRFADWLREHFAAGTTLSSSADGRDRADQRSGRPL